MNDALLRFWGECRLQLLAFRASSGDGSTPDPAALKQKLMAQAVNFDPDRRTSPYNMKSILQDQMDAMISNAVYLAAKWIKDGKPQTPTV